MSSPATPPVERLALYLAFPAAIEEDVIDFCHEHSDFVSGFTLLDAEGFGDSSQLRSTTEVVLGRARRRVLLTVLAVADVQPVLDALRTALPSPEVVYWTNRVERFGRLL